MTGRIPRRVVTGHDALGRSVFLEDGPAPQFAETELFDRVAFYEIWNTAADPAPISATEPREPNDRSRTLGPGAQGSLIRVIDFYPNRPPMPLRPNGRREDMHRTETIDYGLVLEGEIWSILDDAETLLKAGDVIVQRGTDHAWENRSDKNCRMAFILLAGAFEPALKAQLADAELTP